MCTNIKQFLHTWCSQSHKLPPVYNFTNQGGRGKQMLRFNCEVSVDGYNYVGFGSSTSKKDAQTNAARDFVNFLVRENHIQKESVPEFNQSELVGGSAEAVIECSSTMLPPPVQGFSQDPNKNIRQNYITNIFDQKKLEEAEDVDFTADIHGNWSLDNAKARLHQYMASNKIQADYKYSPIGPDHHKSFVCEMSIFCNKLKKTLHAREPGSNKQTSSRACALSLVRQMFHLGVIEPFGAAAKKIKSDQIPPYKISVNPEIKDQLNKLVTDLGLQPKEKPTKDDEEVNMVVNYTIVDFEPQSHQRPQIIPWSPGMQNWNPWLACNIDEGEEAFLPLDEISKRLKEKFMRYRSSNPEFQSILKERENLPAAAFQDHIVDAIVNNQVVLVRGETGSGKTTQIPQFIMDHYIELNKGAECNIIVTQPRRISAITLAERVAQERGENLGQSCGYSVRFETIYPQPYGGLLYCTVGTLLRKMEGGLRGVSHIFVDEIHERDVNTDFLMILLKDMAATYPQIKIILMSASIDVEIFRNFFPKIFLVEIEGRTFPVNYFFLEDCIEKLNFQPDPFLKKSKKSNSDDVDEDHVTGNSGKPDESDINCNMICDPSYQPQTRIAMSKIPEKEISFELIESLLRYIETIHPDGAVLIFLPGWNIIQKLLKILSTHSIFGTNKYLLLPLHSQVPRVDQKKVFQPCRPGVRKIILATNIAESSITINDVMFVIDSCRAKVKMFTSRNNLTSYNTVWASKTNLEQRRGRAGRVSEGFAFHLCSRARFDRLETHQTPEILRTALHDLALMIKLLKLGDTKDFLSRAIEQPPIDAIIEAEHLLKEMKAFDKNDELTPLGRILARLPIEPRMGKMIIFGCLFGVGDACITIAACTSLGDLFIIPPGRKRLSNAQVDLAGGRCSDHVAILNAFQKWSSIKKRGLSEEDYCDSKGLNLSMLKMSSDAASQMKSILINTGFPEECLEPQFFDYSNNCSLLNNVINLLVLGVYPNVCYHKDKRKVFTTEGKSALVHKLSVNCTNFINAFPFPFFIFGEKIRTRAISCKQMSMINPLQLLIFGARKVTYFNQMIVLDDWLSLDMEFELAAEILALRPALEGLMVKVCMNPDIVMNPDDFDQQIIDVVTKLSDPNVCNEGGTAPTNPFLNRKRKNWQPTRSPFNSNQGVPNKFRAYDRNFSNSNTTGNRGPFRGRQTSFEDRSMSNRNEFSGNSNSNSPNSSQYGRQNSNRKIPFVEQPNSSFIRNQFVGSNYNSQADNFEQEYEDNNYNMPPRVASRQNSGFSNYQLENPISYHDNSPYPDAGFRGNMHDNYNTRMPQQPMRGMFNDVGESLDRPFLTGKISSFDVIAQYNKPQLNQDPVTNKTYEMRKYQREIDRQQQKFSTPARPAADRFRNNGPPLNRSNNGDNSNQVENPFEGYDDIGSTRFNYQKQTDEYRSHYNSNNDNNDNNNADNETVNPTETPDNESNTNDIPRGTSSYLNTRGMQNFRGRTRLSRRF